MGLEPTQGRPRQILSLMRLPFRHSCSFISNVSILAQEKMDCNTIYTSIYTGDKTVSISITTGKHLPTIEFGKNSKMVDGLSNQREIVEKILEYLTN